MKDILDFIKFVAPIFIIISLLFAPIIWFFCNMEANRINKISGTHYTAGDIFWVGNTIKLIHIQKEKTK